MTWAVENAVVRPREHNEVIVDVPSGRVRALATVEDGRVRSVCFQNVPSFVYAEGIRVETVAGSASVDVAYGGAFYACLDAGQLGMSVQPSNLAHFIELGRAIKARLESTMSIVHPLEPELREIYGVIFCEGNRNVTVFADGEVDRSPCGSGTPARLALLDKRGGLQRGAPFTHESIIGTRFQARVVGKHASASCRP